MPTKKKRTKAAKASKRAPLGILDATGQPVSTESAARAVNAFSGLWASGAFDCGPQDYGFMAKECHTAIVKFDRRMEERALQLEKATKSHEN
jgi:hypothetical protein